MERYLSLPYYQKSTRMAIHLYYTSCKATFYNSLSSQQNKRKAAGRKRHSGSDSEGLGNIGESNGSFEQPHMRQSKARFRGRIY